MRQKVTLLVLLITLVSLVPAPARSAPATPADASPAPTAAAVTGVSVEYTVKVTPPPGEGVTVTAVFTGLSSPARIAIGLQGWSTLDLIKDLQFSTPSGEPLTFRPIDERTVEVNAAGTVVARYAQNLQRATFRGKKVESFGGKETGYELFLVPAEQQLAAAKVRFDLPSAWTLVSAYPQEAEWSVVKPITFADLSLELGYSGWYFGRLDFDQTKVYPDGFKVRVVGFKGDPPYSGWRHWNVYDGGTPLEAALKVADYYSEIRRFYLKLFGEFPFDDLLIPGPEFWQAGISWHTQLMRGAVEYEGLPHHMLHTYFWTAGRIFAREAWSVLLREGFSTYAEGVHAAQITGDRTWSGMLYERKFHYLRGPKFGNFQQNSTQYVLGPLVAFMVDERIRKDTGGRKNIDDLMALLWRKYKGPNPVGLTDDQVNQTLKELTGTDWQSFYDNYIRRTDRLDTSAIERVKPDFPIFLQEIADYYYNGHPSAYFIEQELVAATGDYDMGVRFQSPYATYSNAHLTVGNFAVAARRYKDLSRADLTESDIVAILGQMTGKDHSDFFTFYRGQGLTVDPADISEFVRTFSFNRMGTDSYARLTPRAIPLGRPVVVEAEIIDPEFAASDEFSLQVNGYGLPKGIADGRELVSGEGVSYQFEMEWPNQDFGAMTQYLFRLPRIERDGKTFTNFTLNLPEDAGVLQFRLSAMRGGQQILQDTVTPRFARLRFRDVLPDYLFAADIEELGKRAMVTPDADGKFRPGENLTRADLARWLVLASGASLDVPDPGFADVAPDHPAYRYIAAARRAGIINGYQDGTFRPDNPVTRAQMAAMIARAFKLPDPGPDAPAFRDVPPGVPLSAEILKLSGAGITKGYPDGTFRPAEYISRGQAAAFVARALRRGKR